MPARGPRTARAFAMTLPIRACERGRARYLHVRIGEHAHARLALTAGVRLHGERIMRTAITLMGLVGLALLGGACGSATEGSEASESSQTRAAVCSPDQQTAAYERMVNGALIPPRVFAGLDIVGGDSWSGIGIEGAEQAFCQATLIGSDETGSTSYAWRKPGTEDDLVLASTNAAGKIDFIQLREGYKGTLELKSRADGSAPNPFGQHTYSIGVGRPIERDGAPWAFDLTNQAHATELFDAMMATYAPDLPSTQGNCVADATCVARKFADGGAFFGARPLSMYFHVADATNAPSTPDYFYAFVVKLMPFSFANVHLKLDAEGPVATAERVGTVASSCRISLGMKYGTFLDTCVNVVGDPAADEASRKKLLGGAVNKDGVWQLAVDGLNPNFSASAGDTAPALDATARQIELDVRASGKVLNEYDPSGRRFTFAASGAIYREYARELQDRIHLFTASEGLPRFDIGAPECLSATPAAGCTGIEQMVTPASPDTGNPGVDRMSVGPDAAARLGIRTVLKPGDPVAVFCTNPSDISTCGTGSEGIGLRRSLWQGSLDQVTKVLGGGDLEKVPQGLRSIHLYVAVWSKVLVKYLNAAHLAPTDLSKPEYAAFTPSTQDITIGGIRSGWLTVSYKDKLAITLLPEAGNVQTILFKR